MAAEADQGLLFVDALRAAEAAATDVLAAWIAVCEHDGLRGGLRAIAEREGAHAELLGERLAELGVPRVAEVPETMRAAALGRFGAPDVSDEEKIGLVLVRYPDDLSVTQPITRAMACLTHDPETHELLRLVAEGEGATIAWLRAYHHALGRRPRPEPDDG